MTSKVTVTCVVCLTLFMTPKCHGVIRGSRDLFHDLKVNLTFDLDLGYDPKRSRGHKTSR